MWLLDWFRKKKPETVDNSMKYLIVGLGNIGALAAMPVMEGKCVLFKEFGGVNAVPICLDTQDTEELIKIITALAPAYGGINLEDISRYWSQQEKIPVERILILVDDLSLPVGKIRMRGNGGAGGHNGLKNIESCMMTQNYARIKFGIGNEFSRGAQVDFVLGQFSDEDNKVVEEKLDYVGEMIKSFCLQGLDRTMNQYNKK